MSKFGIITIALVAVLLSQATVLADGPGLQQGSVPVWTQLRAPQRYEHVVPRSTLEVSTLYANLLYEGNNIYMRGRNPDDALKACGGQALAARWRSLAGSVRGIFVLRDSLFSQQDNPVSATPFALMMPPSWITVAAAATEPRPVASIPVDDDNAWTGLKSPAELFGSFPPSDTLFDYATMSLMGAAPDTKLRIMNCRNSINILAAQTARLVQASARGKDAVISEGAEMVAGSDREYFGEELRRRHVIPIFVENPTEKEKEEGKGITPIGPETFTPGLIAMARTAVYRRRLQDGDMALERYNLAEADERKRAVDVLEGLIPKGSSGDTVVWLWVTGRLDPRREMKGENANAYIAGFRKELAAADIELSRLRLLSKPDFVLPKGDGRKAAFEEAVDRYRAMDLPLNIVVDSRTLGTLMDEPGQANGRQ